jgi:hypothetical protein
MPTSRDSGASRFGFGHNRDGSWHFLSLAFLWHLGAGWKPCTAGWGCCGGILSTYRGKMRDTYFELMLSFLPYDTVDAQSGYLGNHSCRMRWRAC